MTLAPGLLADATVAIAGTGPVADAVARRLAGLGAAVHVPDAETLATGEQLTHWAGERAPWRGLVIDAGDGLASGGRDRLTGTLHHVWQLTLAVGAEVMLPAGRPGRIVFVGPPPGAGSHAAPVRAGLENLARTLSVEWARHAITPVAVLPGDSTPAGEIAELTAYLMSPAGGYFSGCRLELGAVAAPAA